MSEKIMQQSFIEKTIRFLQPLWCNKKETLLLILYFLAQLSFGAIFVFFVRDVTGALEEKNTEKFQSLLYEYGVIFAIAFLIVFILYKGWTYTSHRFGQTIEKKYLPEYVRFDMNYYEKIGTGKSIAIISKGIKMWGGLLDRLMIETLSLIISVGVSFYLLSQIDNRLLGILTILLIFGLSLGLFLNKKVVKLRKKRIELDNIWSKNLVKIIMAKMEILQSGKIHGEIKKLRELHEGQIYYNGKMALYLVPFFVVGSLIITILLFCVFHYFGELYFNDEISLGYIAGLTGALLMMQAVFLNFLDFIKNFGREFSEIQNLWDFFDRTPQIQGYEDGKEFRHKKGDISLKNMSYSYDGRKQIFNDFSIDIAGEKITAFVGPSGGGKSTLVKLVSAYIRPNSGDIVVDDQKLSEVSLKSYYKDIGYLTQEPSVFDGTVRENLLYAVGKEVDEKKIAKIIELAHCEFIYELPEGIETEIGERGIKLSGGQKQRLAIAKIFLKDPKIIILDEPTSALDSVSEKKITEAMHNLFQNRTVLVIAHRLQTVKHADDIVVIENGEIIERGTHTGLTRKKGFYKQMLDLQSGF